MFSCCDHLVGEEGAVFFFFVFFCFSLVCGLCTVCHSLFALLLGIIGKPCSVIVPIPGNYLYYSRTSMARTPMARLPWMRRTHS